MNNWYKGAQVQKEETQTNFEFFNTPPTAQKIQYKKTDEYEDWMESIDPKDFNSVKEAIEDANGKWEVIAILNKFKISWEEKFNGLVIILFIGGSKIDYEKTVYVIDDFDFPSIEEAKEWIETLSDRETDKYIPYKDFNETFWNEIGADYVLYHATNEENKENILKTGLLPKNESRGINNRSTPASVFTSDNLGEIESYGTLVFEIHVGKMKADGYMPTVQREGPIEGALQRKKIAEMLWLYDYDPTGEYSSEGLYESTVIFFGKIPPQYLSVYQ